MKKLSSMKDSELVELYAQIGIAQDDAIDRFEQARVNRLFDKKIAVVNELRSRPGDRRRLLFDLYDHPNIQVRLNAAKSTYARNPERAHAVLEEIAATRRLPQSADAGFALTGIAEGDSALLSDPWIPATRAERLALHSEQSKRSKN